MREGAHVGTAVWGRATSVAGDVLLSAPVALGMFRGAVSCVSGWLCHSLGPSSAQGRARFLSTPGTLDIAGSIRLPAAVDALKVFVSWSPFPAGSHSQEEHGAC